MKKILLLISVLSIASAGSVTPVIGMRFNATDTSGFVSKIPGPVTSIGLKMEVSEGVYSGFDTNIDGTDFRIFLERSFGKIGLSSSTTGKPTFTIGAIYSIYSNLNVELEYMVNQADETVNDNLRMSLSIPF